MVAVAQHKVCQVTLMPLVEETGIVVLGLATAPHVKRFVHHDESHRVAHVQQFGSRRIVTGADGIDTHRLEFCQFAVQGILINSCTQTAEVMMFTYTVDFHILAVEPKTRFGIEAEIAEGRRCPYLVDNGAIDHHLRQYLIGIWALR